MFIDYYDILEIDENATQDEIKVAFRKQAIKWHPDRNPGRDTTIQMQRINEAYLILKDPEARAKFNAEYQNFKTYKEQQRAKEEYEYQQQQREKKQERNESRRQEYWHQEENEKTKERKTEYSDYAFRDETLKSWMNNARKQSVDLAKQTIKDFKGMVAVGFKEGIKASGNALIGQIVISVIVLIIFGIAKSCHS